MHKRTQKYKMEKEWMKWKLASATVRDKHSDKLMAKIESQVRMEIF